MLFCVYYAFPQFNKVILAAPQNSVIEVDVGSVLCGSAWLYIFFFCHKNYSVFTQSNWSWSTARDVCIARFYLSFSLLIRSNVIHISIKPITYILHNVMIVIRPDLRFSGALRKSQRWPLLVC